MDGVGTRRGREEGVQGEMGPGHKRRGLHCPAHCVHVVYVRGGEDIVGRVPRYEAPHVRMATHSA